MHIYDKERFFNRMNNRAMFKCSEEMFALPGFIPERDDLLTRQTLLGYLGDQEGATTLLERAVAHPTTAEMDPTDPVRNGIYFSSACILQSTGRLNEALDTALAIVGDGCSKAIKRKVLRMIRQACCRDEQGLALA